MLIEKVFWNIPFMRVFTIKQIQVISKFAFGDVDTFDMRHYSLELEVENFGYSHWDDGFSNWINGKFANDAERKIITGAPDDRDIDALIYETPRFNSLLIGNA
jgi:hypothetical protein